MTIEVRQAAQNDLNALYPLWLEIMRYHEDHNPYFNLVDDYEKKIPKMIQARFDKKEETFFVAECEGELVGMLMSRIEILPPTIPFDKRGYIAETIVTEKFRSEKVGEQLVQAAIHHFKTNDCQVVDLQVSVKNPMGIKFWKRMGFYESTFHMMQEI